METYSSKSSQEMPFVLDIGASIDVARAITTKVRRKTHMVVMATRGGFGRWT
jgi:hypothetical protein